MLSGIRLKQKVTPIVDILRGAADPTRASILHLLSENAKEHEEIVSRLKLKPAVVSHHLNMLVTTGWIRKERYGKHTMYYIDTTAWLKLKRYMHGSLFWEMIQKMID